MRNGEKRFFKFVQERQAIYLRRKAGKPWPWTDDHILQEYSFTNVFREQDKTTVCVRNCVRSIDEAAPAHSTVFAIMAARWFNRIEVIHHLVNYGMSSPWGLFDYAHWNPSVAVSLLRKHIPQGPWVTGAYILTTPKGFDKLEGMVLNIDEAHARVKRLTDCWVPGSTTLEQATRHIVHDIPFQGDFTAYEVVSDLRWTSVLDHAPDILLWANPGPGALRGMQRVQGATTPTFPMPRKEPAVAFMRNLMGLWRDGAGPKYGRRKAEMRDVEHSLCEFDKYERTRLGQGRPRGKFKHKEAC